MKRLKDLMKEYFSLIIVFQAFFSALFIYSIIIYFSIGNIVSILSSPFNDMVKMIEINKQKIVMQSIFAESELSNPAVIKKHPLNDSSKIKIHIYSQSGHDSLNKNEKNMMLVLAMTQKYTPIAFANEIVYLLYRSYESKTFISTSEIPNFPTDIFDAMNTEQRCRDTRICTKYESEVQLGDRVIISPFYVDIITGKTTVTIGSPIYDGSEGLILGDLNADFHISDYFSDDYKLYSEFQGEFTRNIIEDENIKSFSLTHSASFMADGNTIFIFRLSYAKIYVYHIWLLYTLFFLFYIIVFKWSEVRKKRKELQYVHQDSIKDALTGLYNRKIFDSEFFLDRVRSNPGSVIAIDGNKIKQINDTYGHSVGDLSIQCIAENMKDSFRTSDFLIRVGGDEFVVILPGCSIENALLLSNKLKSKIEESVFYHEKLELSVSCGVVFSESDEPFEDAILRADEVLYEQKNNRYSNEK